MYCRYCGVEISDNAKFCKLCGKSVQIGKDLSSYGDKLTETAEIRNEQNSVYQGEKQSIWKQLSWIPDILAPLLLFALIFGFLDKPISDLIRFILGG